MGSSDTEDQPRQESSPVGPQISHVRATGEIGVGSDRELMQAWGSELTYDRPTGETVLTGSPMHVAKDGHLITATQLVMSGLDDEATQQARVKGPGRVEIGPVGPDGRINPLRSADWQDGLIYSKEPRDEGEPLELLTLTGNAAFRDTEAGQSLAAREIKVWLQPPNDESRTRGSDPTDQRRPERLLATADVYIRSPKLHVEGADHLEIRFRDLPPPEVAVAKTPMNQDATIPPVPPAEPATPVAIRGVMPTPSTEEADSQTSLGMPAEPLVLKAGRVDAWMDRQGEKTEMDRVVCQERVHARQMPNRDNPDGVELAGDVLSLRHTPDGDLLTITAEKRLARAEMIKLPVERQVDREGRVLPTVVKGPARKALSVLGNDIFIDQRNNFAEVKGAGSMYLLSESDLQGKPLEEPSYVHILWADRMEFYGAEKWARFEGDVQATQMESRVSCQNMHVTLDREVWFNPDERPDKDQTERTGSPKIEYVLCDQLPADPDKAKSDRRVPLTLEDRQYDDDRNLIELQRVIAPEIQVDNLSSVMKASGPGVVRVFQPGSKGDPLDGPQPQPRPNSATKEPETEMKLIWVEYRGRMKIQKTPRKATFYDGIDALYAPSDDPEMKPDLVNLPERGLHLRCSDRLVVSELESPDGTKSQELRAFGNAFARSADFRGSAEQINYDQSKETITFVGSKDNPARLMRFIVPGRQGQEVSGSKIIYYRLTRDFKMEDGLRFSGSDR